MGSAWKVDRRWIEVGEGGQEDTSRNHGNSNMPQLLRYFRCLYPHGSISLCYASRSLVLVAWDARARRHPRGPQGEALIPRVFML
ncbi:hypothetical protein E2C01_016700 [Portunus trituberculatus]|uniref:Uncharacterized protein n=1 Tax=Portunus trituberculatus TaxID=210409 RepID=A0A5B7DPS3_PORTR|nr:hypothetical protein [Portunus trituberculatus]